MQSVPIASWKVPVMLSAPIVSLLKCSNNVITNNNQSSNSNQKCLLLFVILKGSDHARKKKTELFTKKYLLLNFAKMEKVIEIFQAA